MIRQSADAVSAPPLAEEVAKSSIRDVYFLGAKDLDMSQENVWISVGQEACLVNFEHILEGGDFLRDALSCLRYIIFGDREARKALATIDIVLQEGRQVLRCTRTGPAVEEIPNALRIASEFSDSQEIDYSVRFVEVAAMQLELVWIKGVKNGKESTDHSYLISLLTSASFVKRRIYAEDAFRVQLIAAARKQRSKRRSKSLSI